MHRVGKKNQTQLGKWIDSDELCHINNRQRLRIHYDGTRFTPIVFRHHDMEIVDDRVTVLYRDIEGDVPEECPLERRRLYRTNSKNRLKRLPELAPLYRWRTIHFKYIEGVCANNNPGLTTQMPSREYVYLDVGSPRAADDNYGEEWAVVAYMDPESGHRRAINSQAFLEDLLNEDNSQLRHVQRVKLFMRRCSSRVLEQYQDPTGRAANVIRDKCKINRLHYRGHEHNEREQESHKYISQSRSPSAQMHLQELYKEGGLEMSDKKPADDMLLPLSAQEQARILRDWSIEQSNSTRISTCACCGGRDFDARDMSDIYVPLNRLSDLCEITEHEAKDLQLKGQGLYHIVSEDNRHFRVVDKGTLWVSAAYRKKHFSEHSFEHGSRAPVKERDTQEELARHVYAAVCVACKGHAAGHRARRDAREIMTVDDDDEEHDRLQCPRNFVACTDWGRNPVTAHGLPELSMLEAVAISKYVVSYDVVAVMSGSDSHKLRSHVVSSPHDSVDKILELYTKSLPRRDLCDHISLLFVGSQSRKLDMLTNERLNTAMRLDFNIIMLWLVLLQKIHPLYQDVVLPETDNEILECKDMLETTRRDIVEGILCDDTTSMQLQKIIHSDATIDRAGQQEHGDFRRVIHLSNPMVDDPMQASLRALYNMITPGGKHHDIHNLRPDDSDGNVDTGSAGSTSIVGGSEDQDVPLSQAAHRTRLEATMGTFGNEFEDNHHIISGSHPTLFPMGLTERMFRTSGTPRPVVVRLLLQWYDGRFAGSESLQFLFFSQMLRSQVTSSVNAHLNGTNDDIDSLIELLNSPNLDREIRINLRKLAAGESLTARGKHIIKTVGRATTITGSNVSWTRHARMGTSTPMQAITQKCGCASVFATVSMPAYDNPLALRLSMGINEDRMDFDNGREQHHVDWTLKFPNLTDRISRMARNPISDARIYQKVIKAFFTILCGCNLGSDVRSTRSETAEKQRGAFGKCRAFFGITEAQRKGLLHNHSVLWTELNPMVISRWLHNKGFRDRVVAFIESIVSCDISREVADVDEMRRKMNAGPIPFGMYEPRAFDSQRLDALLDKNNESELQRLAQDVRMEAEKICSETCYHNHTWTCRPKDNTARKLGVCMRCRLDMGRGPSKETMLCQAEWSDTKDSSIGTKLTRVMVDEDHEWRRRTKRKCMSCRRMLEGGLFTQEEYIKEEARQCMRCCDDKERCDNCRMVSACKDLSGRDIALLQAECGECNPPEMETEEDSTAGLPIGFRRCWTENHTERGIVGHIHGIRYEYDNTPQGMAACWRRCEPKTKPPPVPDNNHDDGLDKEVMDATNAYAAACDDVLIRFNINRSYLEALEILRCAKLFGFHGTILDRIVELKAKENTYGLCVPMAEMASGRLHHAIVTSSVAMQKCEELLEKHRLNGTVQYLVARDLEFKCGRPGAVRKVACFEGDGDGYMILSNHVPRPNHSIRYVLDELYGQTIICQDTPDADESMRRDFGNGVKDIIYMRNVGDGQDGETNVDFVRNGRSLMHHRRTVSLWYRWVSARENLYRALLNEHERKLFSFHELNPPIDAVSIDLPPEEMMANEMPDDDSSASFRRCLMELSTDKRCIVLHQMRDTHRSRYQSEISPVCTVALKCNTMMSVMVSLVSAKAAMFYLAKYFKKDSCKMKDLLILYHKARELQRRFPSRASDVTSDPSRRRAKNFMMKLLNKINGSTCEYTSTQVAMMLLGNPSNYCSHVFWYLFVDPLRAFQHKLHGVHDVSHDEVAVDTRDGADWKAAGLSEESIHAGLVHLYESLELENLESKINEIDDMIRLYKTRHPNQWRDFLSQHVYCVHNVRLSAYVVGGGGDDADEDFDDGSLFRGVAGFRNDPYHEESAGTLDSTVRLYRSKSNKVVRSSQHHDYTFRGNALGDMSPWEYVSIIQIREIKEVGEAVDSALRFGQLENGDYHQLCESHMQHIRQKYVVPILASKMNPPPFPGPKPVDPDSEEYAKWLAKAGKAAKYYGCVFLPHDLKTGKAPCQGADRLGAWHQFCSIMKTMHDATALTHVDFRILNGRYATIYNIAHGLRSSRDCNMLTRAHRSRFSDSLTNVKRTKHDEDEEEDAADNEALSEYMDVLLAQLKDDKFRDLAYMEKTLDELFGADEEDENVEVQNNPPTPWSKDKFGIAWAKRQYKMWQDRAKQGEEELKSTSSNIGSPNSKYSSARSVTASMIKLLDHVVLNKIPNTFTKHEKEPERRRRTVESMIEDAQDKETWSVRDVCWQDVFIQTMACKINNKIELVYAYLETLSDDQRMPFLEAIDQVKEGKQLELFVHGPPGCGKTHFANAIRRRLSMLGIGSRFIAASGVAAILGNGQTLHHLVNMPINMKGSMGPEWKKMVRTRVGKGDENTVILLDEISLVSPKMLAALNERLRKVYDSDKNFGGLHIIVLGDFYQLKVVSELPLYSGSVNQSSSRVVTLSSILEARDDDIAGVELFAGLRRLNLTTQHRSEDEEHRRIIYNMRSSDVRFPLRDVVHKIRELTADDTQHPEWKRARYVCLTNAQRRIFNERGTKNYAVRTNQPILWWQCPSKGSAAHLDSNQRKCGGENLYAAGHDTRGVFVRGLPCFLTKNLSVPDCLANGAGVVLYSLTTRLTTDMKPINTICLPNMEDLTAGVEYSIELPHSVNVVRKKDWDEAVRKQYDWDRSVNVDTKKVDPTIIKISRDLLVPLPLCSIAASGNTRSNANNAKWRGHNYTPSFAMTYWKIQGQTLPGNLVIVTEQTGKGSALTLPMVYVALSRVTHLNRLRWYPFKNASRVAELAKLSYPHDLRLWDKNYTEGLVRLVVDGHVNFEDGEMLDVVLDKRQANVRVELFSSTCFYAGDQRLDRKMTEVFVCRRDIFPTSVTAIRTSELRDTGSQTLNVQVQTSTIEESSDGHWKRGGLREEMQAAELSVMHDLARFQNFASCKLTKTNLRNLCSRLFIRYCEEDGSDTLRKRLFPTWTKAKEWSEKMKTKVTELMKRTVLPSPDMINHVRRHEWCCHCCLPFFNNFTGSLVSGHEHEVRSKRVKRSCGDVNINSKQFQLFNDEVRRHGELWLRGECGILQSRVTSTKSSKRKKKNPQYGSDGVKSKMEDQRKRPKNDKYLLSSRGLLSKNRQSKRKKKKSSLRQ